MKSVQSEIRKIEVHQVDKGHTIPDRKIQQQHHSHRQITRKNSGKTKSHNIDYSNMWFLLGKTKVHT